MPVRHTSCDSNTRSHTRPSTAGFQLETGWSSVHTCTAWASSTQCSDRHIRRAALATQPAAVDHADAGTEDTEGTEGTEGTEDTEDADTEEEATAAARKVAQLTELEQSGTRLCAGSS